MTTNKRSFTDILEKTPSMDAITVLVLGLDGYLLYTQLDYYNQSSLFTVSSDPLVIALQVTAALIVIYILEFVHDRSKESGGNNILSH